MTVIRGPLALIIDNTQMSLWQAGLVYIAHTEPEPLELPSFWELLSNQASQIAQIYIAR
jgi:hypothetical protein